MRIILHVDLDAFYASVEECGRPELSGKPVVIGADPKQGRGRGVVSTANYVARQFGVRSGMPITIAYRKCPNCVFLPVNMDLYVEASTRVMTIFKKHADMFELGGIDECYLDVSDKCKNYKEAEALAKKIKLELKEKENLTCSIGISQNKLVAKIAAGREKPNGLTVVKPDEVTGFLKKLSVRELMGVGPKTEAVLNGFNIFTIGQLKKIPEHELVNSFGKFGHVLYLEARGIDESPFVEEWEAKSIGRQITFQKDTRDRKLILKTIDDMACDVFKDLKESGFTYKTITIKVRYEDFDTYSKAKTLSAAHKDKELAVETAKNLIEPFLLDERKIRLIGFSLSKLEAK